MYIHITYFVTVPRKIHKNIMTFFYSSTSFYKTCANVVCEIQLMLKRFLLRSRTDH